MTGDNAVMAPDPENGSGDGIWCVTVGSLSPGRTVSFTGLPGNYGTSGIVADEAGAVYLWLPNGSYSFSYGSLSWTANVWRAPCEAVFTGTFDVYGLSINSIALTDTTVTFVVASDPVDWMEKGGYSSLRVRAGSTLPLPTSSSALLSRLQVETSLNPDGTATVVIPRSASGTMFYRIEK